MQINVNSPSTIRIKFTDVLPRLFKLYNSKGQLYFFRYLDGKTPRIKFNIPDVGTYTPDILIEVVSIKPIEIPEDLPILPPAERDRYKKSTVKYNPELLSSPAIIYTHKGLIEVGPKFYELPPTIQLFLLLHEEGHYFYKTEENCDLYALVNYFRMGYNRGMAYYALEKVLSKTPQNMQRIKKMFDKIQAYTGNFNSGT